MVIQAVNRSIDASGSGLDVGVVQALSEAVFEVAQFDDQAFNDRSEATLASS
jgi:hypothetical protein